MYRLFVLIMCAFLFLSSKAFAETVTIAADRWCPYNCEPGSEHPGFMIEIAEKVFAKHNIKVEYLVVPWTRAIEESRQNKYTAIVGAAHKDAPDFVFPETAQGLMRNSFYVKKGDTWKFTNIASLAKISLGVIADYSYNEELDKYIVKNKKNSKLIQVISGDGALDTNIKKVVAGRVGAIIDAEYVINYTLAQNKMIGKIEKAGAVPPTKNDNLFVAFSPKNPKAKEYAEMLSKGTDELRKSGQLQKILNFYNVTDWNKSSK